MSKELRLIQCENKISVYFLFFHNTFFEEKKVFVGDSLQAASEANPSTASNA